VKFCLVRDPSETITGEKMADTTTLDRKADLVPDNDRNIETKPRGKIQVLGFSLAGRKFGLDTECVIEIVKQVAVTDMPEAPEYFEGIINIREKIVPLINLQKMLKIGTRRHDLDTQIVIIYGENGVVGLLVDDVSDIFPVPRSSVMRPGRSASPLSQFVSGVVDMKDDLLLLLDVNMLVDHENWGEIVVAEAGPDTDQDAEARIDQEILRQRALDLKRKTTEENFERRRLVTFSLGDEWYGIDIGNVKEISNIVEIYYIPSAPAHVVGTINLRGVIVPVIDLGSLLGLQKSPVDTETSIIVLEQNNMTMGILADRIGDIEEVASETVEPPLSTIDKDRVDCLEGGVELNGRLLGILRLEQIVQGTAAPEV
jgi:purine-binding chemotaxis protein CheW